MNASLLCLYNKAVSVHFLISCFSMHNRKINALNIFWCYCILQLIVPFLLTCLLRKSLVLLQAHKEPLCKAIGPFDRLFDDIELLQASTLHVQVFGVKLK